MQNNQPHGQNQYTWESVIKFLQQQQGRTDSGQIFDPEKMALNHKVKQLEQELEIYKHTNLELQSRIKDIEIMITGKKHKTIEPFHHRVKSDMTSNLRVFDLGNITNSNLETDAIQPKKQKPRFLEDEESCTDDQQTVLTKVSVKLSQRNSLSSQINLSQIQEQPTERTEGILDLGRGQFGQGGQFGGKEREEKKQEPQRNNSLNSQLTSTSEKGLLSGKIKWKPMMTLRSHLDCVRQIFFSSNTLTSVSEDCLVKIWDLKNLMNNYDCNYTEPTVTLREHCGPVFTVTGNQNNQKNDTDLIFTGGADGEIKVWNVPQNLVNNPYNSSQYSNSFLVDQWYTGNDEVIWELNHHPDDSHLISSCSDGQIKLWNTLPEKNHDQVSFPKNSALASYTFMQENSQELDTPTSINWDIQRNGIVSGYASQTNIVIFDKQTTKVSNILKYQQEQKKVNAQPNKIVINNKYNCLISAHEDRHIRFFDMNSNKQIKNLLGHTDAVTSLSINNNNNHVASVSHDGSLRIWDAHKRKRDESIFCVNYHPDIPLIATGGADGLIKIFEQQGRE